MNSVAVIEPSAVMNLGMSSPHFPLLVGISSLHGDPNYFGVSALDQSPPSESTDKSKKPTEGGRTIVCSPNFQTSFPSSVVTVTNSELKDG